MTEFITRSYGNKEFEIIVKTDSEEHYKATQNFARRLVYLNPITNADRIRAMSDEELAEFLCSVFDDDECNGKYICGTTIAEYDQYNIAEWLKLPAQEE